MKTFIAIEFDNNFKRYLTSVRDVVRGNSIAGNFTHDDNFHLTLRYLGETKAELIDKLQEKLKDICSRYDATTIKANKIGAFKRHNKKIIYMEPEIEESLIKMQREMEISVRKLGYEADNKPFVPHITLGREINIIMPIEDLNELIPECNDKITANCISLMESTRENGKLIYKRIFCIKAQIIK